MTPNRTRRSLLQAGGVVAGLAVAGCSQLLPGETPTATPPDVETDSAGNPASYGIVVRNESSFTPTSIKVSVRRSHDGETVFEEAVSGHAVKEEPQEWDDVISKSSHEGELVEYVITGKVLMGGREAAFGNAWVTPGAESAPAIANVEIHVENDPDGGPMVVIDKEP